MPGAMQFPLAKIAERANIGQVKARGHQAREFQEQQSGV
jgi:hypothetical protein